MAFNKPKFSVIQSYDDHEIAMKLLTRLYEEVADIVDQKGYQIYSIEEEYTQDEYGSNVWDYDTETASIYIVLRTQENPSLFYSFEELLKTLLHEIVHCEIGNHKQEFHDLLDYFIEWYENTRWPNWCSDGRRFNEVVRKNRERPGWTSEELSLILAVN